MARFLVYMKTVCKDGFTFPVLDKIGFFLDVDKIPIYSIDNLVEVNFKPANQNVCRFLF